MRAQTVRRVADVEPAQEPVHYYVPPAGWRRIGGLLIGPAEPPDPAAYRQLVQRVRP